MSCDHEWLLTIEDDEFITTANEPLHENTTQSGNATAQMQSGNEPLPKPRIWLIQLELKLPHDSQSAREIWKN